MLRFKTLTIKNFMSIGENSQTIDFENGGLTLVLGENLDTADDTSVGRNGCGKSAILNALSYGLFGVALTNDIKRNNLVNNINDRNMFVIVEFEKNGHKYKIERGRKPNFFKFIVDDSLVNEQNTDEAQGDSKHTQEELEKVLGFSHILFKNIIALNTSTIPFLSMTAKQQREFIEELLGIDQLSEKADLLKEQLKEIKSEVKNEEFRIKTIQESNDRVEKSIQDLERRSTLWTRKNKEKLEEVQQALEELNKVDVDQELELHRNLEEYIQAERQVNKLLEEQKKLERHIKNRTDSIENLNESLQDAKTHTCPTCKQDLHDENHEQIVNDLNEKISKDKKQLLEYEKEHQSIDNKLEEHLSKLSEIGDKPKTYYEDIDQVYNHKNSIQMLEKELENATQEKNPYVDQIKTLNKSSIREVSYDNLNAAVKLRDHQEFLYKLLTNKDSFIRKKIIDQNLAYLNTRLSKFLEKLGLPHIVIFKNDLSVEITHLGRDLDFGNLSRGERTRLILALSWSFRDLFEMLNHPINLFFIDELLDNGLDGQGVENAMSWIKRSMAQRQGKDVFIISHRDELVSKIGNVLKVVKEGGFTSLSLETDYNI